MGGQYHGRVECVRQNAKRKNQFNGGALLIWLISLVISLIPNYISVLSYLDENGHIDMAFWFQCFTKDDVLWTAATLLLFSLINCFSRYNYESKQISESKTNFFLFVIGIFVFVLTEATWLFFKYSLQSIAAWPISLGSGLAIAAMIISTPLQINFIKNEG